VTEKIMRRAKVKPPPRPTDVELAILSVLWRHGPGSVREVLNHYNEGRGDPAGYTTVLKMLQIMSDKGLVERDDSRRPQVYSARLSEEQTQRQLLSDLLERAFGGSAKKLVLQALAGREASEKELSQIESILDRLEGSSE
jgi:BlaI family transcriptional regulator, penicillinase repressor